MLGIGKKLIAIGLLCSALHIASADDYSAEGERRVQLVAGDLIGSKVNIDSIKTITGQTINLSEIDKPVYIKFWATWCVPCREQMPEFESLYQQYGQDIEFIAVNTGFNDSIEAVNKYTKKMPMSMPIVFDDGSLKTQFKLPVTPFHVLVNRNGEIAFVGHHDGEALHTALMTLLKDDSKPNQAAKPSVKATSAATQLETITGQTLSLTTSAKPTALVFFAPWCEWYLAESRPDMSQICTKKRLQIETLMQKTESSINWVGISTNIWTNEDDLKQYQSDMQTALPLVLDKTGSLFDSYDITDVPAVVVLDKYGKQVSFIAPNDDNLESTINDVISHGKNP